MRASMKLVAAAVLTIAWLGPAVASGTQPIKGGYGGGYFVQMCDTAKGEYVVGFDARAGSWVDRIQILCGFTVTVAGKVKITGASLRGNPAGGMGGGGVDRRCDSPDYAVSSIEFYTTGEDYVQNLRFVCRTLEPSNSSMPPIVIQQGRIITGPGGRFGAGPYVSRCPTNQLAVGLHGRAGKFVDALGLICWPRPEPAAAVVVQPKRPAPPGTSTGVGGIQTGPSRWLPTEQTATVNGDVDLYDVPGGGGKVIGMLRAGQVVPFAGCRNDKWCEIRQPAGWVWGDFLTY